MPYFQSMAGASAMAWGPAVQSPVMSANFSAAGCDVFVDLADHIDVATEITRQEKLIQQLHSQIASKEKQLANENFVSRAPADVVAKERAALLELQNRLATATTDLAKLSRC